MSRVSVQRIVGESRPIKIVSFDSIDAITSSAILSQMLRRLDKKFSVQILSKHEKLPVTGDDQLIISVCIPKFLQDDSNHISFDSLDKTTAETVYLFAKEVSSKNCDLAKIALLSIISQDSKVDLSQINQVIIGDAGDITTKQGPAIYPATRPIKRALEYSTNHYIPGVTGNSSGVLQLLNEAKIPLDKTLLELSDEEISRLVSAVTLRRAHATDMLTNIYATNLFNKTEDLSEIAILLNSCAKLDHSDIALAYCLGDQKARTKAFEVYATYKQEIIAGLKTIETLPTTKQKDLVIFNAKDKIKSVFIETICTLLANSNAYDEGTVLVAVTQKDSEIKLIAQAVGRAKRDVQNLFNETVNKLREENSSLTLKVQGNTRSARTTIPLELEEQFLTTLKEKLEVEIIKV